MYPKATFCLLMGEDMFLTLLNWYKPDTILRLAEICAVPRSVGHEVRLEEQAHVLREKGATVFLEQIPYLPLSSTEIREAVREGRSIRGKVPPLVEEYIRSRGLYAKGGN